ncbi:MAG: tetratricopeptide repeat protein [Rhodospirillaceae bacterium]
MSSPRLNQAAAALHGGRPDVARTLCRQALAANPNDADALHILGVAELRSGAVPAAEAALRRAAALRPADAALRNTLGVALHQAGKATEAEAAYRAAIARNPKGAEARGNLARLLLDLGRVRPAAQAARAALDVQPGQADAALVLAAALERQGSPAEAATALAVALAANPSATPLRTRLAELHLGLGQPDPAMAVIAALPPGAVATGELLHVRGAALAQLGRLDEAAAALRQAAPLLRDPAGCQLRLAAVLFQAGQPAEAAAAAAEAVRRSPQDGMANKILGTALFAAGQGEGAVAPLERAVAALPRDAEAWSNLAGALLGQRAVDRAVAAAAEAVRLAPGMLAARNNHGAALRRAHRFGEAIATLQAAVDQAPANVEALVNLGNVLLVVGAAGEAADCYSRALAAGPARPDLYSNAVLCALYRPSVTAPALRALAAGWNAAHGGAPPPAAPRRVHAGPPRIGLVSADFGQHPVGLFTVSVVEAMRRAGAAPVCYAGRRQPDPVNARLRAAAAAWVDIAGLSDAALADRVRADGIDVLVDLAGHTEGNRLGVFAGRAAPLQLTWVGFPGTTGVAAMDAIVADARLIPPGDEAFYTERVLRLPESAWCYDAPGLRLAAAPPPSLARGHATFGCFNSLAKLNDGVAAAWAAILGRVPGSRLVLMAQGLSDEEGRRRTEARLAAAGIDPARVELRPFGTPEDYLAAHGDIDVALDPFPFGGGTTTCDALSMGVPVVSLAGDRFAGRMGVSFLASAGASDLAAADVATYVDTAVALAGDHRRLAGLREGLRTRMAASALCDADRFTAQFLAAVDGAWREP